MDNILRKDETINNMILFAMIWSFGGCMDSAQRQRYDAYLRQIYLEGKVPRTYEYLFGPYNQFSLRALAETHADFVGALQEVTTVYDLLLNLGKWENWDGNPIVSNKKRVTTFHVRKNEHNQRKSVFLQAPVTGLRLSKKNETQVSRFTIRPKENPTTEGEGAQLPSQLSTQPQAQFRVSVNAPSQKKVEKMGVLVETLETKRQSFFINFFLRHKKHFLVI